MRKEAELKVTIDTCLLFSATACDALLTLAELGLFQPIWSNSILTELLRSTTSSLDPLILRGLEKRICDMNAFFPNAIHDAPELQIYRWQLTLPDSNDGHVVATAITSKSSLIVTENLKDFPNSLLSKAGIAAVSFDSFMLTMLNTNPEIVHMALSKMVEKRTNPPISLLEQLLQLENLSPNFNRAFRKLLNAKN